MWSLIPAWIKQWPLASTLAFKTIGSTYPLCKTFHWVSVVLRENQHSLLRPTGPCITSPTHQSYFLLRSLSPNACTSHWHSCHFYNLLSPLLSQDLCSAVSSVWYISSTHSCSLVIPLISQVEHPFIMLLFLLCQSKLVCGSTLVYFSL